MHVVTVGLLGNHPRNSVGLFPNMFLSSIRGELKNTKIAYTYILLNVTKYADMIANNSDKDGLHQVKVTV